MGIIPSAPCWSAPDDRILMRQGNIDTVRHAETELVPARRGGLSGGLPLELHAGHHLRALRHVRRHALLGEYRPLVYGVEETKLLALTGDHAENPTMHLSVAHGPRLRPEADRGRTAPSPRSRTSSIAPHRDFWRR